MSIRRIFGIILRYFYAFNRNLDRWIDAFYWPVLDITVWGLTISALQKSSTLPEMQIIMIISGIILWYVIWRGYYEVSMNILEEFWSENLINFLGTPIKLSEWIIALFATSIIKLAITFIFTSIIAVLLYSVNILNLQWSLIPIIINLLIVGWSSGLFIGSIFLRYGTRMQSLAWAGAFLLMPFSATFFPLNSLPVWAQNVAAFLPSSYIFECMRSLIFTNILPEGMILKSFLLNILYFILATYCFYLSFKKAKKQGISHLK